ncbi:hypothetical protein ADEAN_000099400 [Angomonas deanei]|uniref:Uncharacterized protein n=1 Tax=Angomonas deanei TaxID=59799 RepID=A0A7G2C337_9TRYP|nr:hypothetical protein ADEAN_000099400 [Angomonas deanei]
MEKPKRPTIEVKQSPSEDNIALPRESSLLPGMLRTPNFVVDSVSDWAAPGSHVWEEEGGSPKSQVTPLQPYGSGMWVTAEEEGDPMAQDASPLSPFTTDATAAVSYFAVTQGRAPEDNEGGLGDPAAQAVEEDFVTHQIVASAGLPLSLTNTALQQFITLGLPTRDFAGATVHGSNSFQRNYPNLNDPEQEGRPIEAPSYVNYGGRHNETAHRVKSESEILSDLLHFHANYFPPPPPPRVPPGERRSRAELWYHYASKWDITHRLPPPPRTPIPEMQLEFLMKLPEKTRVPYHGDGWLIAAERWFNVVQGLFDFPDENVGVPTDISVVLDNAVTN